MTHPNPAPAKQTDDINDPTVLSGYALIESLMSRQDEALAELDALNQRVEDAIAEVTASREDESTEPIVESDEFTEPVETPSFQPARRAA